MTSSQRTVSNVLTMRRKPDVKIVDFEEALAAHLKWRSENGDPRGQDILSVINGDYLAYVARYSNVSWEGLDTHVDWIYNSDVGTHYIQTLAPMIEEMTSADEIYDTEHSNWIWDHGDTSFQEVAVMTWTINPAKALQMEKARKEISLLAIEGARDARWCWYTTLGNALRLNLAVPMRKNADKEQIDFAPFLIQRLGYEQAENLLQRFNEGALTAEFYQYAVRTDLAPNR